MNAKFAVGTVTVYLAIYTGLLAAGAPLGLLNILFIAAPLLLILMVYLVLKDNSSNYPDLPPDREYGYRDRTA